jgi:glucuronyl esterase-like protein
MTNYARLGLASLSLLGSLALAGCGSDDDSQSSNPLTPTPTPEAPATPEGTGGTSMTGVPTPEDSSEGVITPVGLIRPAASVENSGAECAATAGAISKNDTLPNPFANHDGTIISAKTDWECRRNEIKKDIEQFEIGAKPDPSTSTVAATYDGTNLNVVVTTAAGSLTLTSAVTLVDGAGPHCVAIGMNGNSSLINGCVQIPFMHDQVVNANQNGMVNQADPFYTVYPELWTQVANYAAWSWGISRLIDGIDQVKDQLNVDMTKIGVHGCSYAGKMALFGGAFDERVALTVAQESGGGGINSWRLSQNFVTRSGTQIEKIDNTNYSWFLPSMRSLDAYSLPHDHHELIAMVAPRAFVTFGNRNFEWLGDESGYKSVVAAQQVWAALGANAQFGYDFTTDHDHCSAAPSQVNTANAFVSKFLLGQEADTNIAIPPDANPHVAGQAIYDLDETPVVTWAAPTLQ